MPDQSNANLAFLADIEVTYVGAAGFAFCIVPEHDTTAYIPVQTADKHHVAVGDRFKASLLTNFKEGASAPYVVQWMTALAVVENVVHSLEPAEHDDAPQPMNPINGHAIEALFRDSEYEEVLSARSVAVMLLKRTPLHEELTRTNTILESMHREGKLAKVSVMASPESVHASFIYFAENSSSANRAIMTLAEDR